MSFLKNFRFALCAVAVAALLALNSAPVGAQTAEYNDAYTIQGFSQPNRMSDVASQTAGIVNSLNADEGDAVRRGECLVQLDRAVHDQKLELARIAKDSRGELENAEAELAAKTSRLERLSALASRNHATPVELMQAEEDLAIARASIQRAQDRLDQQTADYARLQAESAQFCIVAPFDGVIIDFAKEVGEYVGPGENTVCTIAELKTLSVEFLLPRHYRGNLNVNDSVDVLFTVSGQTVVGTIHYISPFPNGETNTFTVKARVDNSVGELSAGERCQLQIEPAKQISTRSNAAGPNNSQASPPTQLSMRGR